MSDVPLPTVESRRATTPLSPSRPIARPVTSPAQVTRVSSLLKNSPSSITAAAMLPNVQHQNDGFSGIRPLSSANPPVGIPWAGTASSFSTGVAGLAGLSDTEFFAAMSSAILETQIALEKTVQQATSKVPSEDASAPEDGGEPESEALPAAPAPTAVELAASYSAAIDGPARHASSGSWTTADLSARIGSAKVLDAELLRLEGTFRSGGSKSSFAARMVLVDLFMGRVAALLQAAAVLSARAGQPFLSGPEPAAEQDGVAGKTAPPDRVPADSSSRVPADSYSRVPADSFSPATSPSRPATASSAVVAAELLRLPSPGFGTAHGGLSRVAVMQAIRLQLGAPSGLRAAERADKSKDKRAEVLSSTVSSLLGLVQLIQQNYTVSPAGRDLASAESLLRERGILPQRERGATSTLGVQTSADASVLSDPSLPQDLETYLNELVLEFEGADKPRRAGNQRRTAEQGASRTAVAAPPATSQKVDRTKLALFMREIAAEREAAASKLASVSESLSKLAAQNDELAQTVKALSSASEQTTNAAFWGIDPSILESLEVALPPSLSLDGVPRTGTPQPIALAAMLGSLDTEIVPKDGAGSPKGTSLDAARRSKAPPARDPRARRTSRSRNEIRKVDDPEADERDKVEYLTALVKQHGAAITQQNLLLKSLQDRALQFKKEKDIIESQKTNAVAGLEATVQQLQSQLRKELLTSQRSSNSSHRRVLELEAEVECLLRQRRDRPPPSVAPVPVPSTPPASMAKAVQHKTEQEIDELHSAILHGKASLPELPSESMCKQVARVVPEVLEALFTTFGLLTRSVAQYGEDKEAIQELVQRIEALQAELDTANKRVIATERLAIDARGSLVVETPSDSTHRSSRGDPLLLRLAEAKAHSASFSAQLVVYQRREAELTQALAESEAIVAANDLEMKETMAASAELRESLKAEFAKAEVTTKAALAESAALRKELDEHKRLVAELRESSSLLETSAKNFANFAAAKLHISRREEAVEILVVSMVKRLMSAFSLVPGEWPESATSITESSPLPLVEALLRKPVAIAPAPHMQQGFTESLQNAVKSLDDATSWVGHAVRCMLVLRKEVLRLGLALDKHREQLRSDPLNVRPPAVSPS